jgi:hypothetical protein
LTLTDLARSSSNNNNNNNNRSAMPPRRRPGGAATPARPVVVVSAAALVLLLATLASPASAAPGCDLSLTFFPEGTVNSPPSLTKAGQAALKPPNKDSDQLLTVPVWGETVPVVHVSPVSPLTTLGECVPAACLPGKGRRKLQQGGGSCARTLAPAQFRVSYSFEGAPPAVAGPYRTGADPPPAIRFAEVSQMPPGTWCADIVVALVPETARVTQYSAGFLPAKDQYAKRTVCFLKKAGAAPAGADAVAADDAPVAAAADPAAAVEEDYPEDAETPDLLDPALDDRKGASKLPGNVTADAAEPVDETKLAQASRYYCLRYWSLGGREAGKLQVPAGDEGITACADACNAKGGGCAGFKVFGGTSCSLLGAINGAAGKADAAVSAACVKNQTDWLSVGRSNAGAGFYCLPGYDFAGDPAGAPTATSAEAGPPPPKPPGGLAKPEVATTSILLCAEQCRLFDGCQFFVQQPGICYLKQTILGGAYGTTGPSNVTLNACVQGSDNWIMLGDQLSYVLPPPDISKIEAESNSALTLGGAAAGAVGPGGAAPGANATYYCLREYVVNGTLVRSGQVPGAGTDDSVVACAAECDRLGPSCAAHITTQLGVCGLYSGIKPRTTGTGDPTIQQLCVRSPVDWDALGDPDDDGSRCLNKYDIAGEGVKDVPYLGNTGGAAVAEFCKAQCRQEQPKCEFVVASAGKCFLKNQPLVGQFGRTGFSETASKACVRSPTAWMSLANMVSASPSGKGVMNGTGAAQMAARRAAARAANGAEGLGAGAGAVVSAALAAAAAALMVAA